MSLFLTIGFYTGLAVGVLHAGHILFRNRQTPGKSDRGAAIYRALWSVLIWTLLGAYLLFFWIVGFVLRPLLDRQRNNSAAH